MFVSVLLSALLAVPPLPPPLGGSDTSQSATPPVVLVGARSVTVRNSTGGIQRLTEIPTNSMFATYQGVDGNTCTITADRDDYPLSNGQTVPAGTIITSHYYFVEGIADPFDIPPAILPNDTLGIPTRGPLATGLRTFTVFCDNPNTMRGFIQIPLTDPLFDPRTQLTRLREQLQLRQPTIYTNPIVDRFGGLVVRYPTWLAIQPPAWTTQTSNPVTYRGATLTLIAEPRELNFTINFEPDRDRPTPAYTGTITCIPDIQPTQGRGAVPALPELPDQTEPGPNGPCMWTPPGPGELTITATITYTITLWANGYTQQDTDYTWTSTPTTYHTDTLTAVNTTP